MGNQQKPQGKERPRTGTSPETLAQAILDNLYYIRGCPPELATKNDWYMALAYTVRDRLLANWVQTLKHLKEDVKVVSYLLQSIRMTGRTTCAGAWRFWRSPEMWRC